jgi:hypothetical protein
VGSCHPSLDARRCGGRIEDFPTAILLDRFRPVSLSIPVLLIVDVPGAGQSLALENMQGPDVLLSRRVACVSVFHVIPNIGRQWKSLMHSNDRIEDVDHDSPSHMSLRWCLAPQYRPQAPNGRGCGALAPGGARS